ncbi:MAG: cytochrome c biogenesis protein CcsA [Chromatiaceae bacterium]|nr:cytochrome c biogenesis protein CcsA [Gammaproteobacteria bacterium]MCB1879679.1 cytochrome c biogenesis protein CcsA [Gammaproteobacteria bacterium]MCB1903261.1 cytochrome c biogenesis protein CcsA [Gammaproteobacteria bacterium]MCP5427270.1 cytochrome c biogenesis protein CcsA [Chromatiaceae bacterium]MCP5447893.1 cytochrome c biogenesis protein CcsA [Chromatiaceae bacterium]
MTSTISALLAIACYVAGTVVIAMRLFRSSSAAKIPRPVGIALGFAGVLLHGIFLYQQLFTNAGINLGFFDAGALVTWTILLLLLISAISKPVENLAILLFPLAAVMIILAIRFHTSHFLSAAAPWGLRVHVLISLLAYSLLAMASVQAILLAVQDHHLRHRHPGGFIRSLPPLQTMEALLFEMIGAGFVLLTIALLSGFMFLEDMFAQRLAHKTVLSIAAWIVFGSLLWGRFKSGWRGQKALIWTLTGFVVLMLAYFGSKFVLELVLNKAAG